MKFNTEITNITGNKEIVRGTDLSTLVENHTFVQSIFLLLQKRLPNKYEERMLNAILTTAIDHGANTASAMNARISASAKNPIHTSLAAGMLGFGERHGMAVTGHMEFLLQRKQANNSLREALLEMKQNNQRVPGFGHKKFTEEDPRSTTLLQIAKETNIFGEYSAIAVETESILNDISSKKLPLNVDGAIGSVLMDMGIAPECGNAVFLISRTTGLLAHILEEEEQNNGIRRGA